MSIPEHVLQTIRDRVSIADVVGSHVLLKRAGRNLKGLCPFHPEKTPSFVVNEERGTYKCFGCGKGGNAFTFLMEMEGKTFPEAAEALAARAGIELAAEEDSDRVREERSDRKKIFEVLALAARYYRHQLTDGRAGEKAREYAAGRGLLPEVLELFGIGASPPGWDGLLRFLKGKGIEQALAERAGLLSRNESGRVYDRFRDRLMFPITDPMGRVVSFGGRVLGSGEPKYLNGPETEVFQKGRLLYGLFQGAEAIRKANRAVLVEGYMDVVTLRQKGYAGCLATLGTALTREHVEAIRRRADEAVLVYDGDEAGQKAMERSLPIFLEEGFPCRAVVLPPEEDPDSFAAKGGDLSALVEKAPWLFDTVLEKIAARNDLTGVSGRLSAVEEAVAHLRGVSEVRGRNEYARRAAEVLRVDMAVVAARITARPVRQAERTAPGAASAVPPPDPREKALLALLLHHPARRRDFMSDGGEKWFEEGGYLETVLFVASRTEGADRFPLEGVPEIARDHVAALLTEEPPADDYRLISGTLEKRRLKAMSGELSRRLGDAEAKGDWEEFERLAREKKDIDKELGT